MTKRRRPGTITFIGALAAAVCTACSSGSQTLQDGGTLALVRPSSSHGFESEVIGSINVPPDGCVSVKLDNATELMAIAFPPGTDLRDGTLILPSGDELSDGSRVAGSGGQVAWDIAGLVDVPAPCKDMGEDVVIADKLAAG